jgi:hypothetical protein
MLGPAFLMEVTETKLLSDEFLMLTNAVEGHETYFNAQRDTKKIVRMRFS